MPAKNIKGYFKIKDNDLFYYPKKSATGKLPHSIKVTGKWRLDKKYNLIFDVDEAYNKTFGQTISFGAKVEHASRDYLEVALLKRTTPSLRDTNSIKFNGRWKVDLHNNFIFEIQRTSGYDELIFGNKWQITKENQVIFFYKRKFLKKEIINSFILEGSWRLAKSTVIFSIENEPGAEIKFRMALNKKKIILKKEKIDFTIGIEKRSLKTFSLFGKWKYTNNTFEFIARFGAKKTSWIFRIKKTLGAGKEVAFELVDTKGESVGIEVALSKKIFKDASMFIKVKHAAENKIEAGFYMPF